MLKGPVHFLIVYTNRKKKNLCVCIDFVHLNLAKFTLTNTKHSDWKIFLKNKKVWGYTCSVGFEKEKPSVDIHGQTELSRGAGLRWNLRSR